MYTVKLPVTKFVSCYFTLPTIPIVKVKFAIAIFATRVVNCLQLRLKVKFAIAIFATRLINLLITAAKLPS
jgi:hypothetical protein